MSTPIPSHPTALTVHGCYPIAPVDFNDPIEKRDVFVHVDRNAAETVRAFTTHIGQKGRRVALDVTERNITHVAFDAETGECLFVRGLGPNRNGIVIRRSPL